MLLYKMAVRNLGRHLRRTIITMLTIGVGLALLLVGSALGDGQHGQMIETGISQQAGHVVVQAKGYQKLRQSALAVPRAAEVSARLAALFPEAAIVPRIFLEGLLTSPNNSAGVGVTAIDAAQERRVNDFYTKIVEGEYLDANALGIVIGGTLAKTLGVGLGDKVVLMAQRAGEIESRLFRVRGIFHTGMDELDGFYAQIPLAAAQEMLGLPDAATQLSVHLKDARKSMEAAAAAKAALAGPELEILSWREALPDLYAYVLLDDAGLYVFILIIAVIICLGTLNTILMSVLERMREFGVMRALGVSPGRLAKLVLLEAALLGLAAVALGVGLGLLANWPLEVYGLNLSAQMGETVEVAGVGLKVHIFPRLSLAKTAVFSLLALGMTIISAMYPAYKAAKLRPVRAMVAR